MLKDKGLSMKEKNFILNPLYLILDFMATKSEK